MLSPLRTVQLALVLASGILIWLVSPTPAAGAAQDDFEIHVVCDFLDDLHWGGPCTEITDYNNWLCVAGADKATFPDFGFGFDIAGYLGSAWRPQDLLDEEVYLDGHRKILGLAKGKNPYITALCPAHPEVKQFWLDQVQKFIDWGADGVDFRWPGHQDTTDWAAYGFTEPVVAEYEARYGVDIRRAEFDRDKWRQLLGEHYTDFYRQAKALLAKHGRKMQVDVLAVDDPAREPPLQHYCVDGIELDFFRWLQYFQSVAQGGTASDEQRALMTDLVRRIRRMTEDESLRRGRPLLLAIRVPDSVDYCRAIGLDVERWLADGLCDLFIAGGDFQLRSWSDSVQLGHRSGVNVY